MLWSVSCIFKTFSIFQLSLFSIRFELLIGTMRWRQFCGLGAGEINEFVALLGGLRSEFVPRVAPLFRFSLSIQRPTVIHDVGLCEHDRRQSAPLSHRIDVIDVGLSYSIPVVVEAALELRPPHCRWFNEFGYFFEAGDQHGFLAP